MAGHAEKFAVGKFRCREQLLKNFQGTSLMGHRFRGFGIDSQSTTLTVSAPMLMPT